MNAGFPSHADEPGFRTLEPLLYNLVYCSRATAGVDDAAVTQIVEAARRANPAHGITGMLVFGSGIFFQWLEGPRASVQGLMAQLQRDPRHEKIVLLSEVEEPRERLFPDWDMELVGSEHIREVLVDALDHARDAHNAQALEQLLSQLDAGLMDGTMPEVDAAPAPGTAQR
jgi:hypothetical protein